MVNSLVVTVLASSVLLTFSSMAAFARCKPPIADAIASARFGSSKSFPTAFIPRLVARSRSVLGNVALTLREIASERCGWRRAPRRDAGPRA